MSDPLEPQKKNPQAPPPMGESASEKAREEHARVHGQSDLNPGGAVTPSELSPEELEKAWEWWRKPQDVVIPRVFGRLLTAYEEQRELITDRGAIIEALKVDFAYAKAYADKEWQENQLNTAIDALQARLVNCDRTIAELRDRIKREQLINQGLTEEFRKQGVVIEALRRERDAAEAHAFDLESGEAYYRLQRTIEELRGGADRNH